MHLTKALNLIAGREKIKKLSTSGGKKDKKKLETYYLYYSLLGEIHSRLNAPAKAKEYFQKEYRIIDIGLEHDNF